MTPASRIERASATDRAFLAMDTGAVPEQLGVVLRLDPTGDLDLADVRRLLAERVASVPRLRRRLVRAPLGAGGPIWVDDAGFDIGDHVREVECRAPGDERALLDTALDVAMIPLRRDAPLWSAAYVTGLAGGGSALVLVLHHALADGIGGLAVLAALVDPQGPLDPLDPVDPGGGARGVSDESFPRPPPSRAGLARDAAARRLQAVGRTRSSWRLLRRSMGAGGGVRPPRIEECSLVRRTGPRRRLAVLRVEHESLRRVAHRHGATTNDAVLVAVAGALHRLLLARGESVESLVVTVPVSGRGVDSGSELGNMVSPLLVPVPVTGGVEERLAEVAGLVRAGKQAATGPPPIALLGWLFRPLARLGGYHGYMRHQRRFHTLVSHVRGPDDPLAFGGVPIVEAVPVGLGEGGNTTVYFEVLTYRGTLTVSVVVDPDRVPDLAVLTGALRSELDLVAGIGRSTGRRSLQPPRAL
jgi:diacylglycerol O-acyltransferase / wax synthase